MNKTYSRVVVPKDLDTGTSTETSTWIAKNISREFYLPMVVSADADISKDRVNNMVSQMDLEGFGHCTNTGACQAECPKGISVEYIRKMNLDYNLSNIKG